MTTIERVYVTAAVVLMAGPPSVFAQEAAERQQPLQELVRTEVVYPQEAGEFQLTIGSLVDRGRSSNSIALPVGVEFGLTDAWQVGAEWASFTRVRAADLAATGTGEIAFGTKYSFMNIAGSSTHAAFGVELAFPRDVDGDSAVGREVEPFVAVATDLTERGLQLFGHIGTSFAMAHDGEEGERELQWNAGGLLPVGFTMLALELNVRNDSFTLRETGELYLTPSLTFVPGGAWEVGVGVPIGVTSEASRVGVAVLMTYER